jgi:hypothetical protein
MHPPGGKGFYPDVKSLKDVRNECAKLGMYPVEIKWEKQINSVIAFLVD